MHIAYKAGSPKQCEEAYLRVPVSSQVYVLYTAMLLLLAAAKRCPPLLKQQSLHAFIWNSASCLHGSIHVFLSTWQLQPSQSLHVY